MAKSYYNMHCGGKVLNKLWQNLTSESEIISGTLTIGSSYTYGEYLLSKQLTSLMQQYLSYIFIYVLIIQDSVINDIKHNKVDIGIVEKEIQDNAIECKKIMEDEMVYIYKSRFNLEWIYVSLEKKGLEQGFIRK